MQLFNAIVSTLLLVAATNAQSMNDVTVHVVQVGGNNSLTFSPDNIQAQPGEVVQFQFMSGNHSVVQSAFTSPCNPINTVMSNMTGFSSGFMPMMNDIVPVFSLMVNDTNPIWAYCSQVGHCAKGMVFAINAPTTGKTFTQFQAMAMNGTKATSTSSMSTMSSSMSTSMMTGTATGAASTSMSSGTSKTGAGSKPIVNVTLLMLFGILGAFFIGL